MDPREFVDVASDLLSGGRQGEWRTATHCGYYAAFHVARALLQGAGFAVPPDQQAHAYLWLRLSNCGDQDGVKVGERLRELRQERTRADYDITRPFEHRRAVGQVRLALDTIQLLDDLSANPAALARVIDGIRAYERDVLKEVTYHP
jgi:uncharacterized protein (UPF0332 family)